MKVAIVANCQGEGIANCVKAMNRDVSADFFLISTFWDGTNQVADVIANHDLIFAQPFLSEYVSESSKSKVHYFPSFAFDAFHPDITYLRGKRVVGDVEAVNGMMASLHSSIVVYGYLRGLSPDQIVGLFNATVFEKLGYLDRWETSKRELLAHALSVDMPLDHLFSRWERSGCFMHTFNHPEIKVASDIAVELMKKAGLPMKECNPGRYLSDPLRAMPVWPVYPEIAARLGLRGDYSFKPNEPHNSVGVSDLVTSSIAAFGRYELETLEPINFRLEDFDRALGVPQGSSKKDVASYLATLIESTSGRQLGGANPYSNLESSRFWKKAVATLSPADVDPVSTPSFAIDRSKKIATAGSCFAQHIARTLSRNGFNYYVTESAPPELTGAEAHKRNFGVFSARYGNIYTARQLVQLVKRVSGEFQPVDNCWHRKDGRFVDPFRPQIEPEGFSDLKSLQSSRAEHFSAVRQLLVQSDVFVFTLGLTEGWRSKVDGAVFPLAPGVAGGLMDFDKYEFVNFSAAEVVSDLAVFLKQLSDVNPACKVILTVSPVPLIATFEPKHVLSATCYSKAVLRVAAEEVCRAHSHVEYFPSFEIITGSFNRGSYFEADLRSVTDFGVSHVMRLFQKHYMSETSSAVSAPATKSNSPHSLFDIVCDEEAIARM